jgi:hypothetical protein
MKEWCRDRRTIYQRKSIVTWLEQREASSYFDDLRVCTIGIQVALVSCRPSDWSDMRRHRTDFLLQLRSVLSKTQVKGASISAYDVILDASTIQMRDLDKALMVKKLE